jgi:hypothetical protein
MDKFQTLWVDTTKSPRIALVRGETNQNPMQMNNLVVGDTLNLNLRMVANGSLDTSLNGLPNYTLKVGVGNFGGTAYASSSNWYCSSSWGYTGSFDITGSTLAAAMVGKESISTILEVEFFETGSSSRKTYLQAPITLYNEVLTQ